jgi:hypothetical protein
VTKTRTWEDVLWTRLRNAADHAWPNRVTFEEMALWPDSEIMKVPNLGEKSVRLFRSRYPRPPLAPITADRGEMILTLQHAIQDIEAAIALLQRGAEP